MTRLIHAHVEGPGFFEEQYFTLPTEWDTWTEDQQESYCVETAVTMQNEIAPCGGNVIEVSDKQLAEIKRDHNITD